MKKQNLIVQKELIQRLVRYKNILLKFKSMGLSKAFSDNLGDAAEDEGDFVYPERDENDRCLDNRFNDVLDRSPDAAM